MMHSSTVIHLIRHGEAAAKWGVDPDPGLSATGQRQARSAAEGLLALDEQPEHIITSPLLRAQETAAAFATRIGQTPVIEKQFRELPAPVPLAQRARWIRSFMTQRWDEQDDSILHWRAQLLQRMTMLEGHVAVFTHFVVINAVVGHVTASPKTLCVMPANGAIFTFTVTAGAIALTQAGAQLESVVN